jgi:hypothetical protein
MTPPKQWDCPITLTVARVFIQFIHLHPKAKFQHGLRVTEPKLQVYSLLPHAINHEKFIQQHACTAALAEIQHNGATLLEKLYNKVTRERLTYRAKPERN